MHPTYISPADTAKLVRAALKRSFPRTRFSVRTDTYAGGAAVRATWVDGPAVKLVERVTDQFAGGRFDGSLDLAYRVSHWLLPDGSAVVASDPGTAAGGGRYAPVREWMPHPEARLVRFGADYVTATRSYSDAFTARVLAKLRRDGFEWDGDEGPIVRGWPEYARLRRPVRNAALERVEAEFGDASHLDLGDLLHRVRHAFMVAAG